jgi:hypothetical protein
MMSRRTLRSDRDGLAPWTLRRARLASCRADDRSNLVEGDCEHVVQDEGDPLGRSQHLQHHEEAKSDRVRRQGMLFGSMKFMCTCRPWSRWIWELTKTAISTPRWTPR